MPNALHTTVTIGLCEEFPRRTITLKIDVGNE